MPIEVGVWRLGKKLTRVEFQPIETESKLEDTLATDLSVLSPGLMLIGRQIPTAFGKFIDLLAMDRDGNLIVIELKRNKTPREVVAQAIDYASWVEGLSHDEIAEIYTSKNDGKELEVGFEEAFHGSLPEELNDTHRMIIVASELDPSTERIITYLSNNFGVPINTVFFRYFQDNGSEYLTRSWLISPQEAEAQTSKFSTKKKREPWNGRDFYVSLGEDSGQNWDDCRKFGFICGSGGKWYTQTLDALFENARVFVNIPKRGYVGVGKVVGRSTPVRDYTVMVDGKKTPILAAELVATGMDANSDDDEKCAYLVSVEWIKAVPREEAYWEKGLFALQHTACKLTSSFTIERLTKHFGIED